MTANPIVRIGHKTRGMAFELFRTLTTSFPLLLSSRFLPGLGKILLERMYAVCDRFVNQLGHIQGFWCNLCLGLAR